MEQALMKDKFPTYFFTFEAVNFCKIVLEKLYEAYAIKRYCF